MGAEYIGTVKSGSGVGWYVYWDSYGGAVYVGEGGRYHVGKARSASEAMRKAEAYLYNK